MTDPDRTASDGVDDRVEQLEDDADAMERPDRAIPLPDESGEGDDGTGPVTGVVP
ncbi:hypothetical protein [Brevundimonas sp. R86498]|uniref:hypothetical protein n=1 Tax=Brevundimonas sp. R86498 TaxID=3093845 RepID=UPI0037CB77A3